MIPPHRLSPPPLPGPRWETAAEEDAVSPPPAVPPVRPTRPPAPTPTPPPAPTLPHVTPEEESLLRLLTTTARHIDQLIEESTLTPAQVNATLLMLELKGMIQRRPGNQYVRLQ